MVSLLDSIQLGCSIEQQLHQAYQVEVALRQENAVLKTEIERLTEENNRLKEQLALAQHRRFGKKAEVGETAVGETAVGEGEVQETPSSIQVTAHTRRKKTKGRLIDFSALPRLKVYHDLKEEEKTCTACHQPLKCIGEDKAEQVEVLPQRLYVQEHIRYKYACCHCETIKIAHKEKAPVPKALAGGSLLTEVIISKYQYHIPLYRQSKIMASLSAYIPDNTLGNWVMQVGDGLMPIYEALWSAVLGSRYLQIDETPIKILKPDKKGYLWSYYAPYVGEGLVIFELNLTRGAHVVESRLKTYQGLIQTDGYSGYSGLRKRQDIVGLGCLTHARRKFHEVFKTNGNKEGIAAQVLERLKPLYALEAKMREAQFALSIKKRLRQKQAWPILKDLKRWLKKESKHVPPKSQLGLALQYFFNQWHFIIQYLRHGMAEIDTNWVENKIRDIAVGKKNWLFMGNQDSGMVHALFYSLILSSLCNHLNPRIYCHYLITKLHQIRQGKINPTQLLPHTIDRHRLTLFAQEQLEQARSVLNSS